MTAPPRERLHPLSLRRNVRPVRPSDHRPTTSDHRSTRLVDDDFHGLVGRLVTHDDGLVPGPVHRDGCRRLHWNGRTLDDWKKPR